MSGVRRGLDALQASYEAVTSRLPLKVRLCLWRIEQLSAQYAPLWRP